ncbi:hypothetical protein K402DRAFT_226696 [Aulographum hederae CBS 113979]|uniref:Uncharacterized protein n=1 Tax=Aulographum hederae CBS 113979 TaxID=1176131 RepID=A0A6G1HB70_9PEZI|nr:hypothetical protein K402DRAFT_226696 [Aulographum hederae CBS 113979]
MCNYAEGETTLINPTECKSSRGSWGNSRMGKVHEWFGGRCGECRYLLVCSECSGQVTILLSSRASASFHFPPPSYQHHQLPPKQLKNNQKTYFNVHSTQSLIKLQRKKINQKCKKTAEIRPGIKPGLISPPRVATPG